jgi:hypothetical protein
MGQILHGSASSGTRQLFRERGFWWMNLITPYENPQLRRGLAAPGACRRVVD